MFEKPIFILGSHKSGTSLLRSLLDGAERLFVIPIEAHFFQYSGYWVDYALRRALPRKLAQEEWIDRYVQLIRRENEKSQDSATGGSLLPGRWDVDAFAAYMKEKAPEFETRGLRGFLDSYVQAIHMALYGPPLADKRFVEKSVEHAEHANLLKYLYPEAKFIHVLRNPYATLVAIRRHMGRRQYPLLGNAMAALENSYYYLYKNPLLIPDYKVVRYEDLVKQPQQIMSEIARFIEVDYDEAMLQPTTLGKPWAGNSTTGERFEGISTRPLVVWRKRILPLEIHFVNQLFGHVLRDFDYDKLDPGGASPYRPCPKEKVRTYLANRMYWKTTQISRSRQITI
ncbi:MAG: sulfotransferase [Chloroflexia bacterium]|nr:sulfotransferase [Chloroflexia bacterium]